MHAFFSPALLQIYSWERELAIEQLLCSSWGLSASLKDTMMVIYEEEEIFLNNLSNPDVSSRSSESKW